MKRRSKRYERPTLFISGNVSRRVPLFGLWPPANDSFMQTLEFCREKYRFHIHGYVIMPDHYHLLVRLAPGTSLSDLLRDFKSYVGKSVVEQLKKAQREDLLARFRLRRQPRRHKDAAYRLLQYDNDVLEVYTPAVIRAKLDYMHNNPVKKGLVREPAEWRYSSWEAYQGHNGKPVRVDLWSE